MADTFGSPDDTEREIRDGRIAAGDARVILMRRRYDAPVEDVWEACTDPDRLARFFMRPKGDLRVGGRFDFDGNAGGEILRCEPPHLLAVTWEYGDRPVDEVRIRLTPGDRGGTILELEHASVSRQVEIAGRSVDALLNDPETGIWGLGAGWELGLLGLDAHLRGTFPAGDPAAAAMDPQVLDLANRCNEGWVAALAGR